MTALGPSRLWQNVTALLACAEGPVHPRALARILSLTNSDWTDAVIDGSPRSPHWDDGRLALNDAERERRRAKLPPTRRAWAYTKLASVAETPMQRARYACHAGAPRAALRQLDEARAAGFGTPAETAALLKLALNLPISATRRRGLLVELARQSWEAGEPEAAERALREAQVERTRNAQVRLLWAQIHNRQGRYVESIDLTRSLLRGRHDPTEDEHRELLDLHARNLLLLGKGHDATALLDAALSKPGPGASIAELNLHLTRGRCAREAGLADATGLANLGRVVREGRRRHNRELEAQAAWQLGIALWDRGQGERALSRLAQARAAWLECGDEYRSLEVENSLAVFLAKCGRVAEADAAFQHLVERLEARNEHAPLVVVRFNYADFKLDMLEPAEARNLLAAASQHAKPGVMSVKIDLTMLECHLLAGAAPDLLLERLGDLRAQVEALDRPAARAYLHRLRGMILVQLLRPRDACLELERAITLYEAVANHTSLAEALVEWAALQTDQAAARGAVARAAWLTRRKEPASVAAARAALAGRRIPMPRQLPLAKQRLDAVARALGALRDGHREALVDPSAVAGYTALAELIAQTENLTPQAVLDAFCETHLGAPTYLLLRRGAVGSVEAAMGRDLDVNLVLRARPSGQDGANGPDAAPCAAGSLCIVESAQWVLALHHPDVALRFGTRTRRLAHKYLELLEACERRAIPHRADGEPTMKPLATDHRARETRFALDGVSDAIRSLRLEVRVLARSDLSIVVEGPTGTGKDRLARHIHELSDRAGGPCVFLDCSALSESLAESELMGHARGAFTGAEEAKIGLLERAASGTLVLDDPAALPSRAQVLIVRALERRVLRRLGDGKERPLDVRVITLCRVPLIQSSKAGNLRPELLYRLSGARLILPPLAQRMDDLPVLVSRMIEQENAGRLRAVTPDVLRALSKESWPGNLTELRSRIRRALLLEPGQAPLGSALLPHGHPASQRDVETTLPSRLRAEERRLVCETLLRHGGHRERTARALGISRRWLQKRLKELEIQ